MASRQSTECVLEEIGLRALIENFKQQKVEFGHLLSLNDTELNRLGVTTIGDRVRLRDKARDLARGETSVVRCVREVAETAGPSSNIRERCMLFRSGRSSRKRVPGEGPNRQWTITAVCLSDTNSEKVPSTDIKEKLLKAGLGNKKILLNSDDNIMEKLCSNEKGTDNEYIGFPQLKHCGGFELLRCQANNRSLTLIDCPWTVKHLKKSLGNQGKVYLRPIQKNLSTTPIRSELDDSEIHKEACQQCGQLIQVQHLRTHIQEACQVPPENNTETELELPDLELTTNNLEMTANGAEHQTTMPQDVADVFDSHPTNLNVDSLENNTESTVDVPSECVEDIVAKAVQQLVEKDIDNPVEMLRYLQSVLVTGRKLDLEATDNSIEGDTNFINVDRQNILETALDEVKDIQNPRLTLEVQFYDEMAVDHGGPRKEFFQLVLGAIHEKYFKNGLHEHMQDDYITIGKLFCLSLLQNGKIPSFIYDLDEQIFSMEETSSGCIRNLRIGLDWLGIFTVGVTIPMFRYILRPKTTPLTVRLLTHLLHPAFSEVGSNNRSNESKVYAAYTRYMREAAGGRRESVTLGKILKFATGAEEEPVLGFSLHPTIHFTDVANSFIPTANTCANMMTLPRPTIYTPLPSDKILFNLYDLAFANSYFGLV